MNPITKLLKEKNLKAAELASFLGVDTNRVWGYQQGFSARLPKIVLEGLEELGVDSEEAHSASVGNR